MAEGKPSKPSIYDPPTPKRELVRNEPTALEITFRDTRRSILQTYYAGKNTVTDVVDKWIGIEKQVERTLKEVAPKGEETILPGAIYVGIAGMAGAILARNRFGPWRMFLIRWTSPLIAIGAAGYYFLPETTGNILTLAREYEARVPAIWETHPRIAKDIREVKRETVKEVKQSSEKPDAANK